MGEKMTSWNKIFTVSALLVSLTACEHLFPQYQQQSNNGTNQTTPVLIAQQNDQMNYANNQYQSQYAGTAPMAQANTANMLNNSGTTGTYVGLKIVELRDGFRRLQGDVASQNQVSTNAQSQNTLAAREYNGLVAGINARLQVGTTPGNPNLVRQWNEAKTTLEKINGDIATLTNLSNDITNSAGLAAFLLDATRASYTIYGAVDADHQQLRALEDEIKRTIVNVNRLQGEVAEQIDRQNNFYATQRRTMAALQLAIKNGEFYGDAMGATVDPNMLGMMEPAAAPMAHTSSVKKKGPALVTILFDKENVSYERSLFNAVNKILDKNKAARFQLEALAPGNGVKAEAAMHAGTVRRHAENVRQSLSSMGIPMNRVNIVTGVDKNIKAPTVNLYVM